jgi:hypothetical protein
VPRARTPYRSFLLRTDTKCGPEGLLHWRSDADAQGHVATAGFFKEHLEATGVKSFLVVAFSVNGRLYGGIYLHPSGR